MTNYSTLKSIFSLGRVISNDSSNCYLHLAYKLKLKNYRLISDGELAIRGANLDIPEYMKEFVRFHKEVIMIANIIDDSVISITLRSIYTNKEFMKIGDNKNMLYGLGMLDNNFKFGDAIVLVEGHLDRDALSQIYKNVLALTTNKLSKSQLDIVTRLTNNFILMLDNDDAGITGAKNARISLKRK